MLTNIAIIEKDKAFIPKRLIPSKSKSMPQKNPKKPALYGIHFKEANIVVIRRRLQDVLKRMSIPDA